jgi:hypothetical protein
MGPYATGSLMSLLSPKTRTVLQWIFVAGLTVFIAVYLHHQWTPLSEQVRHLRIHWSLIAAASGLVVTTYALLIETWRRVLHALGAELPFVAAARIWSVSNLGKYVPGKVWSVTTMMTLARRAGVSLGVAGAAAVVVQVSSIVAGALLLFVLGSHSISPWIAVGALAMLVVVPYAIPRVLRALGKETLAVPLRAVIIALAGSLVAWVMYGVAFKMFALGIGLGHGPATAYITVYTASYVLGFLALFSPGGIGVRESALSLLMPAAQLATVPEAVVLAALSRLWLTLLEIGPGLLALAVGERRMST